MGSHKTHGKIKKAYKDWPEAVRMAALHSKDQRAVVNIYKCPSCDSYHIGKQPSGL